MGNPGERYHNTRHNLGYRVVKALSRRINSEKPCHLRYSLCAAAVHRSQHIILAQPLTYMNLSGRAAAELLQCYRLGPGQMVLVYDDLDLPPGRLRLRYGGGSGGHKGVQSVIDAVGSDEFIRLRVGIGKPGFNDPADYVLDVPPPADQDLYNSAVERAVEALIALFDDGLEAAMGRFNQMI